MFIILIKTFSIKVRAILMIALFGFYITFMCSLIKANSKTYIVFLTVCVLLIVQGPFWDY